MRILVDTNILLDYFLDREPFEDDAAQVLELCQTNAVQGFVAAHSISTMFYVLRRGYSVAQRKEILLSLCQILRVVGIEDWQVVAALEDDCFDDVEDCLQAQCAMDCNADYIITRDGKDFAQSPVPALVPQQFLTLFN
ncbi:MAG: PIN domain-containing protein [Oscillospiraceae bacterium]|nr:PIN domain-containing protein [Oscillospiraceae bacterium]